MAVRSKPIIPNVTYRFSSKTDARQEKQKAYHASIFVLFKPWRKITDDFNNFELDPFLASCSPIIQNYISNIDSLAASKEEANRMNLLRLQEEQLQENQDHSSDTIEMDQEMYDALNDDDAVPWVMDYTDSQLNHDIFSKNLNESDDYISQAVRPLRQILDSDINFSSVPTNSMQISSFNVSDQIKQAWSFQLSEKSKTSLNSSSVQSEHGDSAMPLPPETIPLQSLLTENWKTQPNSELGHYISSGLQGSLTCPIENAVRDFNLNIEQLAAVRLIGLHLFKYLILGELPKDPLRMHISGQGGTGKTHVINAIRHLFAVYKSTDLLKCSAPTGVAAFNIDASTVHSLFGFQINPNVSSLDVSKIDKIKTKLQGVRFFLIDEVSMVSQKLMHNIHLLLQKIHGNDLLFGGINMIVLGDFLQLPPVRATALYEVQNIPDDFGWVPENIWTSFDVTIKLISQMRASSCENLRKILEEARQHSMTESSIDLLNSRILSESSNVNLLSPEWINAPIIVRRNALKENLNTLKLRAHCRKSQVQELIVAAKDYCAGTVLSGDVKRRFLYEELHGSLNSHHSKIKSSKLAPKTIHIAKGAKVMLTHNLDTKLGLVNGATGTIYDILIDSSNTRHTSQGAPGCLFLTSEIVVLFKPDTPHPSLANFSFAGLDNYPKGLVPIVPRITTIKFEMPSASKPMHFLIKRLQLDLELAYAMTDYKCQGKTFSHAIVDLTEPDKGSMESNSSYVIVSRLKSLQGLLILRPFLRNVFENPIKDTLKYQLQSEDSNNFRNLSII